MSSIPELLTVQDAASRLATSPQHIRLLLRKDKISGKMVGRQWLISKESMDNFLSIPMNRLNPEDHPRASKTLPKIKALSFFSGAMGLDIGLERAGIHVLLACEFDKACRKTIEANRPDIALLGDIWKYSAKDIRSAAQLGKKDDLDLMVGGPPCQAFSTAGSRNGFKDERGNVFLKYVELILELKPKYAVIENVRGLLSAPLQHRPHANRDKTSPLAKDELPGGALLYILSILRGAGYGVSFNLYNSANYGAPQIRERVVMICRRDGHKVSYLKPTHSDNGQYGLPKWRTFRQAVKGLTDKHTHVNFPENRLKYYRLLKSGQYWKHLPESLQKEALGNSYFAGGGKTGFFRRLDWDRPSPTLVTHPAMPATDLAHPEEDRPLSIQEYKRIQEFPDDWIVCGSLLDQYRQIGNAVPISLGLAIGRTIIDDMANVRTTSLENFPYSRYKYTDETTWEDRAKATVAVLN